jgi:hypothetical protein
MILRIIDGSDKKLDYGDDIQYHCHQSAYHCNRPEQERR